MSLEDLVAAWEKPFLAEAQGGCPSLGASKLDRCGSPLAGPVLGGIDVVDAFEAAAAGYQRAPALARVRTQHGIASLRVGRFVSRLRFRGFVDRMASGDRRRLERCR